MKSWEKSHKIAKAKELLAKDMEELAASLVEKAKLMTDLSIEQFSVTPETDTLLGTSPCAPKRIQNDFKRYLIKLGCPWEGPFFGPEMTSFHEAIKQGNDWILKMRPAKTGKTQDLL